MRNTLFLLACVLSVFSFIGCGEYPPPTFTVEQVKGFTEEISRLGAENSGLRGQLVASQAEVVSAKEEILELKLKDARQKTEIASKDEVIKKAEAEKEKFAETVAALAEEKGSLAPRLDEIARGKEEVAKGKAEIEKWGKSVEEAKLAYGRFMEEAEKNLIELQIMDVNLRQSQEAFAFLKSQPNTPANRQRMADQLSLVAQLQRKYYVALEEAKNKINGDTIRAKP